MDAQHFVRDQVDLLLSTFTGRSDEVTSSFEAPEQKQPWDAAGFFAALRQQVAAALAASQQDPSQALAVLQWGASRLKEFVRLNMTGPQTDDLPPLWEDPGAMDAAAKPLASDQGQSSSWIGRELQANGEDLVGRCRGLERLLAALVALAEPLGHVTTGSSGSRAVDGGGSATTTGASNGTSNGSADHGGGSSSNGSSDSADGGAVIRAAEAGEPSTTLPGSVLKLLGSWHWWAARALLMQQRVLSGRSSLLHTALCKETSSAVKWAQRHWQRQGSTGGAPADSSSSCGDRGDGTSHTAAAAQLLAVAARLEAAHMQQTYGYVEAAAAQLQGAGDALGVEVAVTGALGRRTVHQVDPKAQLVAYISGGGSAARQGAVGGEQALQAEGPAALSCFDADVSSFGIEGVAVSRELEGMVDESSVYATPQLLGGGGDGEGLPGAVQALLLGWAAQVKAGTSGDELQQWQMAPYVEAVLRQERGAFMLASTARLLKARHERQRSRTRERALMQLEQLASTLAGPPPPGARARAPFAFTVNFPLQALLRKELAELCVSLGLVGAALAIYEDLGMWEQLVVCYQLLDKRAAAQELIRKRLQVNPDEPKLWCALGDATDDPTHYQTAWERSGQRSARAQRSLARAALRRKDYVAAAVAYELALGLSPMWPDAWFNLGFSYLRSEQTDKALQAFTKVAQLEPENGDAWNNLAALWMQAGKHQQALNAATQAVKHKRDSWQAWENCAQAALGARAWQAGARALQQTLSLSGGQRLHLSLAAQLLEGLEREQQLLQCGGAVGGVDAERQEGVEGGGAQEADDVAVVAAAAQLLQMLSSDVEGEGSGSGGKAGSDRQQGQGGGAGDAQAAERSHQQLVALVGGVLKSAVNSSAASPELWGLLARWYGLQGELEAAKEAVLKQVRALHATQFKTDTGAFEAMADASVQLAGSYMQLARSCAVGVGAEGGTAAGGGRRELAAARFHLKGLLKQCEERFSDSEAYKRLQGVLHEVEREEAALTQQRQQE